MKRVNINMETILRKDMVEFHHRMKKFTTLSSFVIAIGFIGFACVPIMAITNESFEFMGIIPVFFLMFVGGALGSSFFGVRASSAKTIINYINTIKEMEYITISDASDCLQTDIGNALFITRELIKNENLADYEVIENKIIARKSLHLTKDDIINTNPNQPNKIVINKNKQDLVLKCPSCGAKIDGKSNNCEYCGSYLKK